MKKKFGSKCEVSDRFVKNLEKSKLVHDCLKWAKEEEEKQLGKKQTAKKTYKVKVPKLEDANFAGTIQSNECTLIITEGDSAKTLVMSGMGILERDYYGVYPLQGKLINVRATTHKKMMNNKEIRNLVEILGLQRNLEYTRENMSTLRYGKLMIMTDQDEDGSHIKGLIINFIHFIWPELLKLNFIVEFITPIVKATKGKQSQSFFSLPEFDEWKAKNKNWQKYKLKYYKGLGTSTSEEAIEYFSNFQNHQIEFTSSEDDDRWINMAFDNKTKSKNERKEWLLEWMDGKKQRKIDEQPEDSRNLYKKN